MTGNWNAKKLKKKKELVTQTVFQVWQQFDMPNPPPYVNFEGCKEEKTWNQLAHYHPDQHIICISERQLNIQNLDELKNTVIHELTHAFGVLSHGTEFRRKKAGISSKIWRPPSGVSYVTGDAINLASKKIRENPEELAKVNEDSDMVKFLDDRSKGTKNAGGDLTEGKHCIYNDGVKKCHKPSEDKCGYCGKRLCSEHLPALIVTGLSKLRAISRNTDYRKWKKYNEDWRSKGGHPCPEFTGLWNRWYNRYKNRGSIEDEEDEEPQPQKLKITPKLPPVPQPPGHEPDPNSPPIPPEFTGSQTGKKSWRMFFIYVIVVLVIIGLSALLIFHSPTKLTATTLQTTSLTTTIFTTAINQNNVSQVKSQKVDVFNITEIEYSITPNTIFVHTGDRVILNVFNNGNEGEDFFIEGIYENLPVMNPGNNGTLVFNAPSPGNYTYFSGVQNHRELGMEGTMVVLPNSSVNAT